MFGLPVPIAKSPFPFHGRHALTGELDLSFDHDWRVLRSLVEFCVHLCREEQIIAELFMDEGGAGSSGLDHVDDRREFLQIHLHEVA